MSDSNVSSSDEPTSSNSANVRARKRSASIMTIGAPEVDDALSLLPDEAAYTIALAFQDQPLAVTIRQVWPVNFANVAMTTLVEYLWQGSPVHSYDIIGPYDPDVVFPLTQALPASVLSTGGIRQLSYRVSAPLLMPPVESFRTSVNVDKTAPNFGNPGLELIFDPEVLSGGVTEDYLAKNGGVPAEAQRWVDVRLEDQLEFFWGELPNVNLVGTLSISPAHVAGAPIVVLFDEAFIRNSGENRRFASYRLIDRAGNIGPFSALTELQVNLQTLPDLPRPEVPLSEVDGLIDLDDARTGVTISIPRIDDAQGGDTLVIFWNTHTLPGIITIDDVQIWPIPIPVPWAILSSGGFAGPVPVRVRYLFRRGTASKDSPNNFLIQDFSVAGPDPQGPDPINTQLPLVVVKGVTGDDTVNQLDAPGPVRTEVALFDNPIPGQRMELFWGGEAAFADDYEVQPGDVAGKTVTFWVPWVTILGAASGQIPVYYWTDNLVNRQRSADKRVQVVLDTLMGLKGVVLLNDSDRDFVQCDTHPEPWTGVYLGIPWDTTHFEVGDRLEVYWSSYPTKNGSGAPFPGTETKFDVELTLDDKNAGEAKVLITPFNPLFTLPGLVKEWGSGVAYYRLFKASGPTGVSSKKLIYIDLKRPGGGTCLGPTSPLEKHE